MVRILWVGRTRSVSLATSMVGLSESVTIVMKIFSASAARGGNGYTSGPNVSRCAEYYDRMFTFAVHSGFGDGQDQPA